MPRTYTSGWDKWGNVYVRYPTRIKGSYYFHSILYNASNKSLNVESWNKLGRKASHGCIRLTPLDAQWINYNCKKGTRVRIVNARGEGLAALHDQIKAELKRNGHASVQPTLKPTPTPIPDTISQSEGKKAAIKSLQSKLRSRGFYPRVPDGVYDAETIAAWNAYQKARGWEEDSIATTQEQIELTNDQDTIGYAVNLSSGFEGIVVKKGGGAAQGAGLLHRHPQQQVRQRHRPGGKALPAGGGHHPGQRKAARFPAARLVLQRRPHPHPPSRPSSWAAKARW